MVKPAEKAGLSRKKPKEFELSRNFKKQKALELSIFRFGVVILPG